MALLDTELKYLPGVTAPRAKELAEQLDIHTFRDLLYHFPFRHIDRSKFYTISEFTGMEMPTVQVRGRFVNFRKEGEGKAARLCATFSDGTKLMEVIWFRSIDTIQKLYLPGRDYVLFGKPSMFRSAYSMVHPEVEAYDPQKPPEGLRGIYNLTDRIRKRGLIQQRTVHHMVRTLLSRICEADLPESLPAWILEKHCFPSLFRAVCDMHTPSDAIQLQKATLRLKFEELYYIQLHLLSYSYKRMRESTGPVFSKIGGNFNTFYHDVIPFELTEAQKRVLREIREDMRHGRQMNRLLQGDVGSGKTMVAFMTMLMALDNGYQAVLMAPTEILAAQHYESLRPWAEKLGISIALLTGSTRAKMRGEIDQGLVSGDLSILIGTHALIEEKVKFARLGLAVIDEQHRFGVAQRARLWTKAEVPPHILVMTATPIPRTLAMTVYGDLSVSVIDQLPPGRKPIDTWLRSDDTRADVNRLILHELRAGHQAYIVYPLVHENEKLSLKSVEQGYERIMGMFPDYKVCCVHGQLKPDAKDLAMQRFVSGEAQIMVATTVIEVGVNVPNASVMVIENAEKFGLSQLHQLRGRVGRGADKSYCVLVAGNKMSTSTRQRLSIMVETTDGFLISEADMKLRGPGDLEGTRQSGLAFDLRLANLARDGQIVELARQEAENTYKMAQEGRLTERDRETLRRELLSRFAKTIDWSRIS